MISLNRNTIGTMATPLRYSEAAEQVQRFIAANLAGTPGPPELLPLLSSSGHVLAQPIHADRDQPPFPRSTRDGFACRAAEANSHEFLRLAARIRAGEDPSAIGSGRVEPGELWEIMTGAPVPPGADAVFMVEHAEFSADPGSAPTHSEIYAPTTQFVRLAAPRSVVPGENIVPAGAEARAGDLLIPTGTRIEPPHIALAAQCGYAELAVYHRPRAAILSTGDELVPVEATPGPSQIRNSNAPMLAALVAAPAASRSSSPPFPTRKNPSTQPSARLSAPTCCSSPAASPLAASTWSQKPSPAPAQTSISTESPFSPANR
jgi:molybdopterin molybdotransferase